MKKWLTSLFLFFALASGVPAAETNGQFVFLEGISVGDKIVREGSFLLRAEWVKQHPAGS